MCIRDRLYGGAQGDTAATADGVADAFVYSLRAANGNDVIADFQVGVDRIFLAGGSSIVTGLVEAVADRTQVPTELFSPFQGMEFSDSIRERQLRIDAPSLLVATGLAMRRFDA